MPTSVLVGTATQIVFRDTGGTAFTLSSLGTLAARESAVYDFGAASRYPGFSIDVATQFAVAPVINTQLEIYLGGSGDETTPAGFWGGLGNGDTSHTSAAGIAKRNQLIFVGGPIAETAAVGPFYFGLPFVPWTHRRLVIFAYNATGQALAAVGTFASTVRITPRFPENQ